MASKKGSEGALTYAELKNFKLGKLLGIVEDVFNEPEGVGRSAKGRPLQPYSYDFSTTNTWRIGWLSRARTWSFYAQNHLLDNRGPPDKNLAIHKAGNAVRYLVKKLQLYPQNIQDTAMYAFRAATVFIHWEDKGQSCHAAWLHPTKFTDSNWYFLGSCIGMEFALLESMRQGELDLRKATYTMV